MKIPPVVQTILRSAAPTLLTALALPPPFNIIASAVVSGVMAKYLPAEQAAAQATAGGTATLTPEQVTQVIEKNANNPEFILALRQAEVDLEKYETEAGIRFAELELKDRQRAGEFQLASGIGLPVFRWGMGLVAIALGGMILIVGGALYLVWHGTAIPPDRADVAVAAFGLVGAAVGFINGMASSVVAYYWGSSQGSREKSAQLANERADLSGTVQDLAQQLGKAAAKAPPPITDRQPAEAISSLAASPLEPAVPAPSSLLDDLMPSLTTPHHHFADGVEWALTPKGVAVDRAAAQGTPGNPTTIAGIWERYGPLCCDSAKRYGVPVELIVATIATESRGDPNARRAEPQHQDESVGLMQTLVRTARAATGRAGLKADDLLDPATSIAAGTAYIAQQRGVTHFDPPLVAAAYNAGSIRRDDADANRWRLLCYPKGTGQHVDRFVAWFSDCMRLSAEQDWAQGKRVPSFAARVRPA